MFLQILRQIVKGTPPTSYIQLCRAAAAAWGDRAQLSPPPPLTPSAWTPHPPALVLHTHYPDKKW